MMGQVNDKILSAVILMQRVTPRLNANDRSTLKRQQLVSIQQSITMALQQLHEDCKDVMVLTPLMDVVCLIDSVTADASFVETDNETKQLVVENVFKALSSLYLFAGKFYMEHEFTWNISKGDILRSIVNSCVEQGYYFGEDEVMCKEGVL